MTEPEDRIETSHDKTAPAPTQKKPKASGATEADRLTPPESEEASEGAAALTAEEQRVPTNRSM